MLTKQMFITENNPVHIKFRKYLLPFRSEVFFSSPPISTGKHVKN